MRQVTHTHMHPHMRVPRMNRQWVPERLGLETDLEIHYLTKLLIWGMR